MFIFGVRVLSLICYFEIMGGSVILVIVRVMGGLGNQMFQYALYRNLKTKFEDVKLDISSYNKYSLHNGYELGDVFDVIEDTASLGEATLLGDIKKDVFSKVKRKILGTKETHYIQKTCNFTSEIFKYDNLYLDGYWQSEKFFYDVKDVVINDFKFKKPLLKNNKKMKELINNSNSVSIHIRRGDYVSNPSAKKVHGDICTKKYYRKAIKIINTKVENPTYFIFSDDIEFAKKNLRVEKAHFISWNKGDRSYNDMHLMSLCQHNIIANSSFSWWGAYLNTNPNKIVLAPNRWFNDSTRNVKDLIPNCWTKIEI